MGAPILVADIGGTNARLALADADGLRADSFRRYRNRNFSSFAQLIDTFLRTHGVLRLQAAAVAVAGPVISGRSRLTNLDWQVDCEVLRRLTAGGPAVLVNDMVALGYAVAELPQAGLIPVSPDETGDFRNGQALILGVGTGLNASVLRRGAGTCAPVCFEAELGHAELPATLARMAAKALGPGAQEFRAIEDCLSGRGLSRIHTLLGAALPREGADIVRRAANHEAKATQTLALFAALTGAFCRASVFSYLPLDGIYLAGSVARGVFGEGGAAVFAAFESAFRAPTLFGERLAHVPVYLINDDAAALRGCLVALAQP